MDWIVPFWQTLNTNAIKLINIFIPKSKSLIIIMNLALLPPFNTGMGIMASLLWCLLFFDRLGFRRSYFIMILQLHYYIFGSFLVSLFPMFLFMGPISACFNHFQVAAIKDSLQFFIICLDSKEAPVLKIYIAYAFYRLEDKLQDLTFVQYTLALLTHGANNSVVLRPVLYKLGYLPPSG